MAFKINIPFLGHKQTEAEEPKEARPKYDLSAQFRDADWRNPATLPPAPRFLLCGVIAALVLLLVWVLFVQGQRNELQAQQQEEEKLRQDFIDKTTKVANLGPLIRQRQQAEEYVTQLEKQLPGRSEMANLLSDINQAGVGRNLQFELFKPGSEEVKSYYAQLPVSIRVSGQFSEIAAFVADVAHLSRIVTLGNMNIGARKDAGWLIMEATANTYRYLDKSEKLTNAKDAQKAGKKTSADSGAKP